MTEAILKGALVKEFRASLPEYVTLRHEDRLTSGIPDITTTGDKMTSWLEVKFANPNFQSRGIQDLTLLRLQKAGSGLFVVYREFPATHHRRTYIVNPRVIGIPMDDWQFFAEGFDHKWVVNHIKELHVSIHYGAKG